MREIPRVPSSVLKNIGSNWALNVVQILVFMVLTTFVVNTIEDAFGVWEAIVAAAGPLQLLILGVPMATVRGISRGSWGPASA